MGACVASDHLKEACAFVDEFGLKPEFPDLEERYERKTFDHLMEKRVWSAAAVLAEKNPAFQACPMNLSIYILIMYYI